ncbi:hypothetical protein BU15DRAFT_13665, partial [Melanogaster broomeanus]
QRLARRIRCEEPFCNRPLTRPADFRHHIATLHKNPPRMEVLKETGMDFWLWYNKCEVILGRVDARQRHECHGPCECNQTITETHTRNDTIYG